MGWFERLFLHLELGCKIAELTGIPRYGLSGYGQDSEGLNHFVQIDSFAARLFLDLRHGTWISFSKTGLVNTVISVTASAGHAVGGGLDVAEKFLSELGVLDHGLRSSAVALRLAFTTLGQIPHWYLSSSPPSPHGRPTPSPRPSPHRF